MMRRCAGSPQDAYVAQLLIVVVFCSATTSSCRARGEWNRFRRPRKQVRQGRQSVHERGKHPRRERQPLVTGLRLGAPAARRHRRHLRALLRGGLAGPLQSCGRVPVRRLRRFRGCRAGLPARPRRRPAPPCGHRHRQPDQRRRGADDQPRLGVLDRARAPAARPGHAAGRQQLHRARDGAAGAAAGPARASGRRRGAARRRDRAAGPGHRHGRVRPDPRRGPLVDAGHRRRARQLRPERRARAQGAAARLEAPAPRVGRAPDLRPRHRTDP